MATAKFSKFVRPEKPTRFRISDRDLDLLEAILRYRFSPVSEIVKLVGGNEDVTHRRLRVLWEHGLANRWAFPGIRTHSQFYYYLDNREALDLLTEHRGLQAHPQMIAEIKSNLEKDYAQAAFRGQHMQLGFLKHSLMLSRLHFLLEMACRSSEGRVQLESWSQGGVLAGRKIDAPKVKASRGSTEYFWEEPDETERLPVEPDAMFTLRFTERAADNQLAHFFYEADRGSMNMTDMLRKFRGYYHFIKKHQHHKGAFGIHPIRAVLVETTDEMRGQRLMELATHPLVCGQAKRSGLFCFSISPMFTDPAHDTGPLVVPQYLHKPEIVFDPIWALPDRTMRRLSDKENSAVASKTA